MDRVAVISDIHGNSPALRTVLADIQRQECTRLFVLGDVINGFDPHGCLDLLRTWDDLTCLKGNAEAYVLTPNPESIQAHDENWHDGLVQLVHWFRSRLSPADLDWLQSLPDYVTWDMACFAHDSPLDRLFPERWHKAGIPLEYQEWFYHAPGISSDMAESEWEKLLNFMGRENLTHVFCGHTHAPFLRRAGIRTICNVGSLGMPLDGDPRPAWVLIERNSEGSYQLSPKRTEYDIDQICQLIEDCPDYPDFQSPGMKAAYQQCLKTGVIWKNVAP